MACVEALRAARTGQLVGQGGPFRYLDAVLADHGYEWWDLRPRGGLVRVRVLHGPNGQPVDVSVALARIEVATGAPARCWGPAARRHVCRTSCCTRRHRP